MEELIVKDPKVTTWEPLYSRDPADNLRVWKIWVQDDVVYRTYGRVDRKLRAPVGRAIAGTATEPAAEKQAILYAQRAWDKKAGSSYSPAKLSRFGSISPIQGNGPARGETRETGGADLSCPKESGRPLFPMHASTYDQTDLCLKKHLQLARGAYIQPKLDGVRCVATRAVDGSTVLSSRAGKRFPWFQKICKDLEPVLDGLPASFVALDGELYCESLVQNGRELHGAERFAAISGAANVRRTAPCPFEDRLALYVFDCIDADGKLSQADRFAVLDALVPLNKKGGAVVRVPTYSVSNSREVDEYHDRFVAAGFEGAVVRAQSLTYAPTRRSLKMRKYKRFDDGEFRIVGAKPGHGTESGAVVWICQQKGGGTFDCRPASSIAERRGQFKDWPRYVGCLLTVQYQGLSADDTPRFPVGVGIRREFQGDTKNRE